MMKFFSHTCQHCNDKALLAIRIAMGLVLAMHGYAKIFGGMTGFTGMLTRLSFPMPEVMAWIVALLEFVGGIALIIGLFTKYVSALVTVQFVIILLYVKKLAFPSSDTDLLILGSAVALLFAGAGDLSVDAMMGKKKIATPAATMPPANPS